MNSIKVTQGQTMVTKNEMQEDYVIRITKHKRGYVITTSANMALSNTLFLNTERDIAQDLLFNEISQILQTDLDVSKTDTQYVCPKCGQEIMKYEPAKKGHKSFWRCENCGFKIPHYKRS